VKPAEQRLRELLTTPWTLVIALVVSFSIVSLFHGSGKKTGLADTEKTFPYTFITSVETREYNAQGLLQYQLNTPLVTHFQVNPDAPGEQDYTLFDTPRLRFQDNPDEAPWHLSAHLGRSSLNGKLLFLNQDVLIQQETASQGLIQIETTELLVKPAEQYAETDKAVKMRSAKGQVDAVGMTALMRDSRVQLQSDVRAIYEPR